MLTQPDVRRRRIIGALAVAAGGLLLVLALLAITGVLGAVDGAKSASNEAVSAGAAASSSGDSAGGESNGSDAKAPLTVLNASGTPGLAGQGRDAFEAAGWSVDQVDNMADGDPPEKSTVYYPEGDEEAQAAAENLAGQFSELAVEQAPDGFAYDGVVVVLTGDWEPGQ